MKTRSRGGGRRQASSKKALAATSDDSDNNGTTAATTKKEARIELFFTSPQQLQERVQLLQSHGYYKFNLVNKNAQDQLLDWATAIVGTNAAGANDDDDLRAHVCAHYSLKYNKAARQGHDAHVQLFEDFLQEACKRDKNIGNKGGPVSEILLVSGGHNRSKPRPKWNTLDALQLFKQQQQQKQQSATATTPTIAVAYNPYIPEPDQQEAENKRLQEK